MTPSLALCHFLASPDMESCKLTSYQDGGGVWTNGVGNTHGVSPDSTITMDQAMLDLQRNLTGAGNAVSTIITVPMLQNQFDAMVSLAFNIGWGNFKTSSVARDFNAGLVDATVASFALWNKIGGNISNGLVKRRACEAMMFMGQPWNIARYADESKPYLSTATLTRCMEAYA
jgi:lysozyme